MPDFPAMTPEPPRGRNRNYRLAMGLLRKFLTVFFMCLGAALLASSYLVWKNNDLLPAILGTALFLFAGANFIAQGIMGIRKWKRRP